MSLRSRLARWSLGSLGSVSLLLAAPASAVNTTWIGGNTQWDDGGTTASWNPADEPDSNDAAIFNTNNTVTMGTDNVINGLTMSASSELLLNGHTLTVDGPTTLSGSGTRLDLTGALSTLDAADITINNGATLFVDEGAIESLVVGAANSTVTINAGGTLSGNGELSMTDSIVAATTLINNNGTITALNPAVVFIAPAPATLHISATDADARIDLDGSLEGGVVNVNRNQTLDVDVPLADIFNGTIAMAHETKLDISSAWILGTGGAINVANGAVGGIPGTPAGKATIAGASFSQNSGAITVADNDGTLQFDAPYALNGGTLTNNGTVVFGGTTNISVANAYSPATLTAQTVINGATTVSDAAGNFNWDGPGTATTTVNGTGTLSLSVNQIDTADNIFGGTITLNDGGDMSVAVAGTSWTMAGTLSKNNAGTSVVSGDRIVVSGTVNANGGTLNMPAVTTSPSAVISIAGTLTLGGASEFGGASSITGAGMLQMEGTSTVTANTTINVATFDWDGVGSGTTQTINDGVVFTINSTTWDPDDAGDVDDNVTIGSNGAQLVVNNVANWTMARTLTTNTPDVGVATIGGSSRMTLSGSLANFNVNGNTDATARVTFGASSTTTIGAAGVLRLRGGTADDANIMAGGTISGAGLLAADTGKMLQGFGTINANIDFDGNTKLRADNGTLTINGAFIDVDQVGTADADGTLHVTNAWNNNTTTGVQLNGGVLSGGTITNDVAAGISGHGVVNSRVINNSQLYASIGETLVFETAGNDNDWDGTTNAGAIIGGLANIELRDTATFGFTGSVTAANAHRVLTNGFALDFNPGSSLILGTGGKFQSTTSTDIGGTVTVGAGGGTIEVQNNFFLTLETGSATNLTGNLQLKNNNINIEAGATFAGGGAIVIPDGSHVVADNLANIGVLVDMQGAFRPGNFEGIGRIDLLDYQQADTGELYVELRGTALNAFDRLVASGDVVLDGYLNIDIDEVSPGVPFVPALGQTFNIITGNTVTGTFDYADVSGMPAGLAFHINYLANAVQLQVVNKPIFSADFDDDGDVDATDLAIWKNAFNLNQLGDANGDNKTDGADFMLWQRQFGSVPAVAVGTPAAAAVPEPSGFALLAFAAAGVAAARRRELANLL